MRCSLRVKVGRRALRNKTDSASCREEWQRREARRGGVWLCGCVAVRLCHGAGAASRGRVWLCHCQCSPLPLPAAVSLLCAVCALAHWLTDTRSLTPLAQGPFLSLLGTADDARWAAKIPRVALRKQESNLLDSPVDILVRYSCMLWPVPCLSPSLPAVEPHCSHPIH